MGKRQPSEYIKAKEEYQLIHNTCLGAKLVPHIKCQGVMSIHHAKGREGDLLTNKMFFKLLCRAHHDWVHRNPKSAIELKLSYPKDEK